MNSRHGKVKIEIIPIHSWPNKIKTIGARGLIKPPKGHKRIRIEN